ncbi:hypothetical protein TraAM80_07556 [Trypanosoma rangeli]|uniref:Uncharacterized protein n=1 Tax=Trypanosoma rangeli TaxID=5698 RepID=A0A3R7K2H6_TRYRA|nr:uncharacterized protein TraAM80_07556 [Trypanosoma rangeli]RNF00632.1 hypothetical protein TraAM80_07556 [Trypanosoma rangeli]|eukprot:RNF00632.1 hypothetical protein TraAM80_07556 [Trypanosoma rangeli]
MRRPCAFLVVLLVVLYAAMFTPVGAGAEDADADVAASSFEHLEMLEVGDLRQMLHEKQQPFQHLHTKQQLINALVELHKKEKLVEKIRRHRRQHVLRVEYCSG